MSSRPYHLTLPARCTTGVVFASPHSGRMYPASFLRRSVLDERAIRSSEDAFVDRLLEVVPDFGAPLLTAIAPRAFVDLNRAPDELDPAVIEGVTIGAHNPRINSGLGVVPRVVAGGKAIYRGKMARHEAEARIDTWWHPYHAQLAELMAAARREFSQAILIDMHSMPHEALDSIAAIGARSGLRRPEVVVGDRYGTSASEEIVSGIQAAFEAVGLRVVRNTPFAGAYIVQTYGRPQAGHHAVQVEIDRSLYMNEREIRPNGNFQGFRQTLAGVLREITGLGRSAPPALAAE